MKFLLSIWRYVVNVKSSVKILSIFVAFLENMNFKGQKCCLFAWGIPSENQFEVLNNDGNSYGVSNFPTEIFQTPMEFFKNSNRNL